MIGSETAVVSRSILLLASLTVSLAIEADVFCNGTFQISKYKEIFNIRILVNGTPVLRTEEEKTEKIPHTGVDVGEYSGRLSGDTAVLIAVLNIEYQQIDHIQCDIYGLSVDKNDFINNTFKPLISFEAALSFHLFLSSILLVYCPFIIMPSLWCSCPACTTYWRNPEETLFKFVRAVISLSDGILFLIWWLMVYSDYGETREFASYATFAYIEGCFIFMYALFRCLFKFLESPDSWVGPRRAYNGRVATSYGAVITPVICWLMIRFPRSLTCTPIEIVFWVLASLSLMAFMYVSHLREDKHWDKQSKED